jgi:hypothetical protein
MRWASTASSTAMWRVCRGGWHKEAAADISSHAVATLWLRFVTLRRGTYTLAWARRIHCMANAVGVVCVCGTFTLRALQFAQPLRDFLWILHERLTVLTSLLSPMSMLRRAVRFGDAKKSSVEENRANEKRKRESERASECLYCKEPEEFGCAVPRKTNESCPRIGDLNESETRKARYARRKARTYPPHTRGHLRRHYQHCAVRARHPC